MVLMRIGYPWRDDELQRASRLDKHYITYLSQKLSGTATRVPYLTRGNPLKTRKKRKTRANP
jgi:hypothetical protein